ncbi:MAG: VTC domain-containing protein [Actinomycetota bacterium]
MSRLDTKIALRMPDLHRVLGRLASPGADPLWLVDTPTGVAPVYSTLYFDTPDLRDYRAHHNGRRLRRKYRYRRYHSTDAVFFEIKQRSSSRRTTKERVPTDRIPAMLGPAELALAASLGLRPGPIVPTLEVGYRRLTLVGPSERITIDLGLRCRGRNRRTVDFSHVAILEVKQERRRPDSSIADSLRALGLRPHAMSKYCLGVAGCFDGVRDHRFRPRLRRLAAMA